MKVCLRVNNIYFVFTHIHRRVWAAVQALVSTFPISVNNITDSHNILGVIRTHDLCIYRAVSYQLTHRDLAVARGSSTPVIISSGAVTY